MSVGAMLGAETLGLSLVRSSLRVRTSQTRIRRSRALSRLAVANNVPSGDQAAQLAAYGFPSSSSSGWTVAVVFAQISEAIPPSHTARNEPSGDQTRSDLPGWGITRSRRPAATF